MLTDTEIINAYENSGRSSHRAAIIIDLSPSHIIRRLKNCGYKIRPVGRPKKDEERLNKTTNYKSVESEIDIIAKIENYLDNVVMDGYIFEEDLCDELQISKRLFKETVKSSRFSGRRLCVLDSSKHDTKKIIFSSKKGIEKLKEEINLSRYIDVVYLGGFGEEFEEIPKKE